MAAAHSFIFNTQIREWYQSPKYATHLILNRDFEGQWMCWPVLIGVLHFWFSFTFRAGMWVSQIPYNSCLMKRASAVLSTSSSSAFPLVMNVCHWHHFYSDAGSFCRVFVICQQGNDGLRNNCYNLHWAAACLLHLFSNVVVIVGLELPGTFMQTVSSLRGGWVQSYSRNCLDWKTYSRPALYIFGSSILKPLREAHTRLKAVKWWLMRHPHNERAPFHYFGNNLLSRKHQKPGHFVVFGPLIFLRRGNGSH